MSQLILELMNDRLIAVGRDISSSSASTSSLVRLDYLRLRKCGHFCLSIDERADDFTELSVRRWYCDSTELSVRRRGRVPMSPSVDRGIVA